MHPRHLAILAAALFLPLSAVVSPLHAQDAASTDRRIIISEDADYFGFDYRVVKKTPLENCKKVCLRDDQCRAFTYNTSAEWCFLKSDHGELKAAENSVAGRVVATPRKTTEAAKPPALTFVPAFFAQEAKRYAAQLSAAEVPPGQGANSLRQAASTAMTGGNPKLAIASYRAALKFAPEDHALWVELAYAVLAMKTNNNREKYKLQEEAIWVSLNAYANSAAAGQRALSLGLLATALERRQQFRPALEAYKASLLLADTAWIKAAYDKLHAQRGFRIVDHSVDSESASPRICVRFSEKLRTGNTDYSKFVTVNDGAPAAVEAKDRQVCIDGAKHGERYQIGIRTGIPSEIGEVLERPTALNIYVRDRSASARFAGRNYVLPRFPGHGIPVVTVNTDTVEVSLYRIGERALSNVIGSDEFFKQLNKYDAERLGNTKGEKIWQGELDVERVLNKEVTTKFPIDRALPERKPGVYVMVAHPKGAKSEDWKTRATQWFIVSDIGLSVLTGDDGLHVFARSLTSAKAIASTEVRLIARNNEVLGTATTDADGHAHFEAGLTRGKGGVAPALVTARAGGVDYAFLNVTKPGFDLSDRGVEGRAAPGPIDVFMYTERGIYRPGATVHLSALVRDRKAQATSDIPLTLVLERPDGVESRRTLSQDQGLGGHTVDFDLLSTAMRGTWRVSAYADVKAPPLAVHKFLVEDFIPDRIEFDLNTEAQEFALEGSVLAKVVGRFLYGLPASRLRLEGEVTVSATTTIKAFEGYSFGLGDERVLPVRTPLSGLPLTDGKGTAKIPIELSEVPDTTRPLEARLTVRMREASGRAVERELTVPVERLDTVIGVKPAFDEGQIGNGDTAEFEVIAVAPDGSRAGLADVTWNLVRIKRNFQWYQVNGRWNYEPVTQMERVASGKFDLTAEAVAKVAAKVEWGRYRLEITGADASSPATSIEFNAGWYVEASTVDTPDMLQVTLDKKAYKPGDTARVNITPRFSGIALVQVVSDRLISMKPVEVSEAGATVDLPVGEDWAAGVYVTATLFRPSDVAKSRMPGRALGLQWLSIDATERTTSVEFDMPSVVRPRQPLDVLVSVPGLPKGERALLTVAAVDVGILNMTGYTPPAPEKWYFGQRRLGTEFRDIYGQLIDGMQGVEGKIRSGGGGLPGGDKAGSPPAQKPVALFSGIVELDGDGRATVSFDVPEFNGTLRLMAVAWTRDGVGSGTTDVIVRDPVVVTASMPRFLAPGDNSRLRLDIDNAEGPAGDYQVSVESSEHITVVSPTEPVALEQGKRKALDVPLTGAATGIGEVTVRLTHSSGIDLSQTLALKVRPAQPPISERQVVSLNENGRLTISADRLADRLPGTGSISLAITRAGVIDVPGLLHSLDRYPYGCAEQTTSRALPLLYMSDLATQSGLGEAAEIKKRVQKAIFNVLSDQSSTGSFGLWGPGSGDLWLNAYISDFLTRARERGYDVPELGLGQALSNLQNTLGYAPDVKTAGRGIAYALYVLARNRRATVGDLRYYADTKLDEFGSPLSKAHVGAALALYGETARAATVFQSALSDLENTASAENYQRKDYGSRLRDAAATLALAAETKPAPVPIPALSRFVTEARNAKRYTSTQEKAWLLLAARALLADSSTIELDVNGDGHTGNLVQRFTADQLRDVPFSVVNKARDPVQAVLTVTGVPDGPRPAGGEGFEIERKYYTLDGQEVATKEVGQSERFIVVIKVKETNAWPSRLLIADLLPAGLEIDNPSLMGSADLKAFPWIRPSTFAAHLEFRDDRFIAALDRKPSDDREVTFAYMVRAVTPGIYALPPAMVEDMYRPHLNARTEMGRIEVIGPGQ